ncbi:cinnamoyl-CoA reductase 1-like [Cornus florida]|uniref:cinnamoyl-CoA reductase 1-like n=1 Tax=Cornus florida TaxID=4283 RepID=UPI00289CCFC5|nr:cinnamoyl-CoA reductase 1-like [Cornus florida]
MVERLRYRLEIGDGAGSCFRNQRYRVVESRHWAVGISVRGWSVSSSNAATPFTPPSKISIDLLHYDSIVAAVTGANGVFHLASPNIIDQVHDPEKELLDPAIKGTNSVLTAAKELGVRRVAVTSSISAITPSRYWPADVVKDENCWADIDYCKTKGLWYPLSKTLAEKAAWEFAKEKGLDVVVVNPGTVLGPILPPALNASMLVILRLLQGIAQI